MRHPSRPCRLRPPRAVVAATARRRGVVVEGALQELHAARAGLFVLDHVLLLGDAFRGDPAVAILVLRPRSTGRDPAALHTGDRAIDIEHLQQQLQRSATDVDHGLERRRRQRVPEADRAERTRSARSRSGIDAVAK
jgi:hypothetical protein